ncbi:MAG: DUF4445 domain-containing protein [Deltaproteobacteria bacterium]|nr:DUF4445 domain-containing protein [Deltaproteobacteria bacterium]
MAAAKTLKTPPPGGGYGIALDVGTTTLAGSLVDTGDGRVMGTASLPNPQKRWGADVISRIESITGNPRLLERLQRCAVSAFDGIISELLRGSGKRKKELKEISAAGNSVMEHILIGVSPGPIGTAPYKPVFKEAKRLAARDIGLDVPPRTRLYAFPIIGGFVGGDAVAVTLSTGIAKGKGNILAIDIGTNSEIILSTPRGLFTTSAPAGPAFEGGEMECGMTAAKGAISGLRIEGGTLKLDVIGRVRPGGICGSGIVDAAAELFKTGVIDPSGRIKERAEVPTNLADRIKKKKGENSFIIFRGPSGEITLSQRDVRAVQVAKAALKAGISVVLEKAKTRPDDIEKVYIAGAFGSHLKKESLADIGVVDRAWLGRVESVGDAVLNGARLTLLSDDYKKEAEEIAKTAKYIPLSGSRLFEKEFIKNMSF